MEADFTGSSKKRQSCETVGEVSGTAIQEHRFGNVNLGNKTVTYLTGKNGLVFVFSGIAENYNSGQSGYSKTIKEWRTEEKIAPL